MKIEIYKFTLIFFLGLMFVNKSVLASEFRLEYGETHNELGTEYRIVRNLIALPISVENPDEKEPIFFGLFKRNFSSDEFQVLDEKGAWRIYVFKNADLIEDMLSENLSLSKVVFENSDTKGLVISEGIFSKVTTEQANNISEIIGWKYNLISRNSDDNSVIVTFYGRGNVFDKKNQIEINFPEVKNLKILLFEYEQVPF